MASVHPIDGGDKVSLARADVITFNVIARVIVGVECGVAMLAIVCAFVCMCKQMRSRAL